jgi:hypothetical protein
MRMFALCTSESISAFHVHVTVHRIKICLIKPTDALIFFKFIFVKNCPKHVEFLDKNKFGKINASVGFIKRKHFCTSISKTA